MLTCKIRNLFVILGPLFILAAFTLTFLPSLANLVLLAFGVAQLLILAFRGRR